MFLCYFLVINLQANILTFEQVKTSLNENFPKIVEQQEKLKSAESKLQKNQGAFDLSLNLKGKQYQEGYYDGQMRKVSLDKPLSFMNSNLSLGQKKGVGIIPVYNQEYATDDAGEFFIRFELSLLRYRSIDPVRFDMWSSRNQVEIEKLKMALKRQDVYINANLAYWKWFFYFHKKKLYEELVSLNKSRLDAVEKRVQKNDLAKIYLVESLQYLYAFEGELASVEGALSETQAKLKIYFQDLNQESLPLTVNFQEEKLPIYGLQEINNVIANRPEIKINKILLQIQDFDISLAEQKMKPKLDLAFEHYDARDKKSPYLDETVVALSLQIPLETNLGKGDINRAQAEKRIIHAEREYFERELESVVNQLDARIRADAKIFEFARLESDSGKKLQNAEWIKFRGGASDFFLINTRDVNYAKARLKVLESYVDYQISYFQMQLWNDPPVF